MLIRRDFLRRPSWCDQSEFIQTAGFSQSLGNAGKQEFQDSRNALRVNSKKGLAWSAADGRASSRPSFEDGAEAVPPIEKQES